MLPLSMKPIFLELHICFNDLFTAVALLLRSTSSLLGQRPEMINELLFVFIERPTSIMVLAIASALRSERRSFVPRCKTLRWACFSMVGFE